MSNPLDALAGYGRDVLVLRILELERQVEALEGQCEIAENLRKESAKTYETYRSAMLSATKERNTMLETLTAAQAAGTTAELGRQRARALLRQVLATDVIQGQIDEHSQEWEGRSELLLLNADIAKELGS